MSCQTVPAYKAVQLPTTFAQYFDSCLVGDGAVNLQLFEDEDLIGAADLEWIVKESSGWRAEVVNPMGQTLLKLSYAPGSRQVVKEGQLAEKLPDFAVDEQGFLRVKGRFVPIRAVEVPCFFKFRFPVRWLDQVTDFQMYGQSAKVEMREDKRRIDVNAGGIGGGASETKVCSDISWSHFLGLFSSELIICETYAAKHVGTLRGLENLSLRWVGLDD